MWPVGQAVKTPPFHGGNRGSIPLRVTNIILLIDAGWSSPVARRAHNPKAAGSNPAPAINFIPLRNKLLWNRGVVGLTCLPVTQEIAGSNPVGSAIFTKGH